MERQSKDRQIAYPRPTTRVSILHIGIACCALTMGIVIAVAMTASG